MIFSVEYIAAQMAKAVLFALAVKPVQQRTLL
jgi:hypothetical protein